MIKFENTDVYGFEHAIRGMRNPFDSWDKSDSRWKDNLFTQLPEFHIGETDAGLCHKLNKGGSPHNKFLRQIVCWVDITGPLLWWKEFDTYRAGVEKNACSTMHRLTAKPFALQDFSFESIYEPPVIEAHDVEGDFEEMWVEVPGHPKYRISNMGRVWSHKSERLLKPQVNSSNYKKVMMDKQQFYVHRLVAASFCDNPNHLPEVNHKDGNKWNNNYTNLEWVTKSENSLHAVKMGLKTVSGYTRYKVSRSARRFTDDEVAEIRSLYNDGMTKQEIADKIGCSNSLICDLLNGNSYRQIELSPMDVAKLTVDALNDLREQYISTKDPDIWRNIVYLLPSSYNQKRTVMMSYQAIRSICEQRKGHKLKEWHEFIDWARRLPNAWLLFDDLYIEPEDPDDNDSWETKACIAAGR